jgi:hypothetical protein
MFYNLQQTIYEVLAHDILLQELNVGIFDEVPENEPFPFIVLGDTITQPFDIFEQTDHEATFLLHIFDQDFGMKYLETIMDQIDVLFDKQTLPLAEPYHCVSCRQESAQVMRESDGLTRHGTMRYKIIYQKNNQYDIN